MNMNALEYVKATPTLNLFLLLVIYQIKHFVCDYPLQGTYMLGKFKSGCGWILPLLAHSLVHGLATFLIALLFKPELALWLGLLDMTIHFIVDRIKASPNLLGQFKPLSASEFADIANSLKLNGPNKTLTQRIKSNTYFWWSLGFDQGLHHLTHYLLIWRMLS